MRVAGLQTFRRAIADATNGSGLGAQGSVLIVVPTRGAARLLARTSDADIVTRDELYDRFHARLASPPRRLSPLERDVLAQAAARATAALGHQL